MPRWFELANCSSLILPNNFSTSALIFLNGLVLMYVGRVKIKYIASIIGIGFIGALLIYGFAKTYPQSTNKIMLGAAATVVAGILSTIIVLIIN